jgi:cell filamentation protein
MARNPALFPDPHFNYEHGILENIPGFTDQDKLDKFERIEATRAILNLQIDPVKGHFDGAHIRQIHARIFQRIYPWAGQFRQVNMSRSASYPFAVVQFLEMNLDNMFSMLAEEKHLKGLDTATFASRAAYYLGELNSIHPFREGNGRTQREFIRQLASEADYRINWIRVTREQMYEASIESHSLGRNTALAALIGKAIEPKRDSVL